MVDLLSEQKVDSVAIYNRIKTSHMVVDRLNNFFIVLSNLPLPELKETRQYKDMFRNG